MKKILPLIDTGCFVFLFWLVMNKYSSKWNRFQWLKLRGLNGGDQDIWTFFFLCIILQLKLFKDNSRSLIPFFTKKIHIYTRLDQHAYSHFCKWSKNHETHYLFFFFIPRLYFFLHIIPSESNNISVFMVIWVLPNVVQIRGDKSIRSKEIRKSDLQRSEHWRSGGRAEVSNREMDLAGLTPLPASRQKRNK